MSQDAKVVVSGAHVMLTAAERSDTPRADWFDPKEWRRAGAVAIETSGRGEVLIVAHGDETWVLRHYRRGGLVARFIDDHYVWLGAERTRAFREWRLLRKLRAAKLPVPNPVAAHIYRTGVIYTADIITSYLPDTRKLSWFIEQGRAPADCWRRIGTMIGAVHDHGVDHPDLTAHNVLLDAAGAPFLVDFDNAELKPPGAWQRAGMQRFNRSLRKVALETGTEFDAAAWREVEAGYAERRAGALTSRPACREWRRRVTSFGSAALRAQQVANLREQLLFGRGSRRRGGRRRFLFPLQLVQRADEQEDRERNDHEVEHGVDEDAVLDDRGSGGFGFRDARVALAHRQVQEQVAEVHVAHQQADRRHDDVGNE